MEISFELARVWDFEPLLQLVQQLRQADPEGGAFDEAAARAAIPAMLADPSIGRIWLIKLADETIGYIALALAYSIEFGGRIAFIDELYIAEPHRRRGIGALALSFVEERAAALEVRALLLEVTRSNAAAKALYVKQGFVDRRHQLMIKRVGGK